jgi:hypothetical protein
VTPLFKREWTETHKRRVKAFLKAMPKDLPRPHIEGYADPTSVVFTWKNSDPYCRVKISWEWKDALKIKGFRATSDPFGDAIEINDPDVAVNRDFSIHEDAWIIPRLLIPAKKEATK